MACDKERGRQNYAKMVQIQDVAIDVFGALLKKYGNDQSMTIDQLLSKHQETILRSGVGKRYKSVLFPQGSKTTELEDWDLTLFCSIFINSCSLPSYLEKDVERIRSTRNEIHHLPKSSVEDGDYSRFSSVFKTFITNALNHINDQQLKEEVTQQVVEAERLVNEQILKAYERTHKLFLKDAAMVNTMKEHMDAQSVGIDVRFDAIVVQMERFERLLQRVPDEVRSKLQPPEEYSFKLLIRNCTPDKQEEISLKLVDIFEEELAKKKNLSLSDDDCTELKDVAKAFVKRLREKKVEPTKVEYGCVCFYISCDTFESFMNFLKSLWNGKLREIALPLQNALRCCFRNDDIEVEPVMSYEQLSFCFENTLDCLQEIMETTDEHKAPGNTVEIPIEASDESVIERPDMFLSTFFTELKNSDLKLSKSDAHTCGQILKYALRKISIGIDKDQSPLVKADELVIRSTKLSCEIVDEALLQQGTSTKQSPEDLLPKGMGHAQTPPVEKEEAAEGSSSQKSTESLDEDLLPKVSLVHGFPVVFPMALMNLNTPASWQNCLVLTNIPSDTTDEHIGNYVEVICKRIVTSLNRQRKCPSVAVVQFETAFKDQDISAWEKRLKEKRLYGNQVTIQALGQPNGVVVYNVPQNVSNEFLELYFESKRSGGLDGCVIDVDNKANGTYVVNINDLSAVKSILSKDGHTIKGADVMVDPWFETLHCHLLKTGNADGPKLPPPVPKRPTGVIEPRIGDTSKMPMKHKIGLFEDAAPLIDRESHHVERKPPFSSSPFRKMDDPVQAPPIMFGSRVSVNVGRVLPIRHSQSYQGNIVIPDNGVGQDESNDAFKPTLRDQKNVTESRKRNFEKQAEYFENKVLKQIEHSRPKRAGHVELCSAKARCFKSCYLKNVESALSSQRKGTIRWTETGNGAEYKLVVHVEGDEDDFRFVESMANKIWSETFDFEKVCTDDADLWLLMTGLKHGSNYNFLTTCEERFNCWLDVSKDGEVIPPTKGRLRVSLDSAVVLSSEQSSSSDSEGIGTRHENLQDIEPLLAARERQRIGRQTLTKFKPPDLSDEDAMQAAFRESLESSDEISLTEGLDRSHAREFRHRRQSSPPVLSYSNTISGVNVVIKKGELVKENADVLVNILSPDMQLRESIVSKVFLESCGQRLQMEFDSAVRTSVISTTGCGLGCKDILHVGLKKGKNCECVSEVMQMILDSSEYLQCQSLAMPPLGGGRLYQYPIQSVASQMFQVITDHFQQGSSLQTITVMAYDRGTFDEFKTALAQVRSSAPGSSRHFSIPSFQRPLPAMTPASNLYGLQGPQVQQFNAPPNNQFVRRQHDRSGTPLQHRHSEPDIRSRQSSIETYQTHTRSRVSERPGRQHSKISPNQKRAPYYNKTDKITMKVFAETKDECIKAKSKISKTMRDELLFEEKCVKMEHISKASKDSIVKIISKYNIRSIKGNKHYILKGKRQNVSEAHKEILKLLINDAEKSRKLQHRTNVKRGTVEFAESMAHQEANIPHYWELYKENTPFSEILSNYKSATGKDYNKIAIEAHDLTYSRIEKMVYETFDSTKIGHGQDAKGLERLRYSKLWITKIQRIENPQLFRRYIQKRQDIFLNLSKEKRGCWPTVGQLPRSSGEITTRSYLSQITEKELYSEINEVYLFHGTKPDTIQTICNTGLDPRLGSGKAMFGSGIYGAEKSSKADQYTDDISTRTGGAGNEKKMFLMRVILGKSYLSTDRNPHKYKRPPCTQCYKDDCKIHDSNFHSVVGNNKKIFREFVVYDGVQCYPEYLITYERR